MKRSIVQTLFIQAFCICSEGFLMVEISRIFGAIKRLAYPNKLYKTLSQKTILIENELEK